MNDIYDDSETDVEATKKQEKNKLRRINIVVSIETYGTRQGHTDALDSIENNFRESLRSEIGKNHTGTGLSGFCVIRNGTTQVTNRW